MPDLNINVCDWPLPWPACTALGVAEQSILAGDAMQELMRNRGWRTLCGARKAKRAELIANGLIGTKKAEANAAAAEFADMPEILADVLLFHAEQTSKQQSDEYPPPVEFSFADAREAAVAVEEAATFAGMVKLRGWGHLSKLLCAIVTIAPLFAANGDPKCAARADMLRASASDLLAVLDTAMQRGRSAQRFLSETTGGTDAAGSPLSQES